MKKMPQWLETTLTALGIIAFALGAFILADRMLKEPAYQPTADDLEVIENQRAYEQQQ
jgi:hypothetical protein